tara:strand:+ start:421 stop:1383 length:963 start_codon:yes stop_codon:yes gene_type:complete
MKFKFFIILTVVFFIIQCKKNNVEDEINSIPISINFDRFDKKFYNIDSFKLNDLKKEYSYLFPEKFDDIVWVNRRKDSLQLILKNAIEKKIENFDFVEDEINYLFKHVKYYFPKTNIPKIVTLINNVDYQSKIIYLDSLVLISLDTYLGKNHEIYNGIPNYIKYDMDISFLSSHIADKFLDRKINYPNERTFLSQMLYYGKKLYLKEKLLPLKNDTILIGYSKKDFTWAKENEIYIWKYFIEKELLYNTDSKLIRRFLDPSPFSKFYLEIDNQSPGKIGRWIGWQIVKSFMKKNPEVKIEDLILKSSQELFIKSGYKPKL